MALGPATDTVQVTRGKQRKSTMAVIQVLTTRHSVSPRTRLSRSAREMVAAWPLNHDDTQAVVSRAARRDVANNKKLFHDREDLWAVAWILVPMLPVAVLYAVYDNTNLNLYRYLRSDLLVFLVEVIPGLFGALIGCLLAFWWLRVLRPNWLRTVAFEMGHPVCRTCSHWNFGTEIVERCRECGQRLSEASPPNLKRLPETASDLTGHWVIPPDTEDTFLQRYWAIHTGEHSRQRWGRFARKTACVLLNMTFFAAGAVVLFLGNKLNDMPNMPPKLTSLMQDHGGVIAIGLLILFFAGLWFSSLMDQRVIRRALAGAARDLELPVCSKCLEWCPDSSQHCPVCKADFGTPAR